jgi:hypothetical protein
MGKITTKSIALVILIFHCAILLFISATWYKYNKNVSEFGGEMADGIFMIALLIATIYYFGLTVWAYLLYRNPHRTNLQLLSVFFFGILTMSILLYKLYF